MSTYLSKNNIQMENRHFSELLVNSRLHFYDSAYEKSLNEYNALDPSIRKNTPMPHKKKLSQKKAAEMLGISLHTYVEYEQGLAIPSRLYTITQIGQLYSIPWNELCSYLLPEYQTYYLHENPENYTPEGQQNVEYNISLPVELVRKIRETYTIERTNGSSAVKRLSSLATAILIYCQKHMQ